MSNKFYPTKTLVTAVMMIKIGKSEIPALSHKTRKTLSFASLIKKYLDNEYIKNGKRTIQHVIIESKHGFLGFTSFRFKKKFKKFRGPGSIMEKKH